MKPCRSCGHEKPLSEFPKHKAMKDGHINTCTKCSSADGMRRKALNREDPGCVARAKKAKEEHLRILKLNLSENLEKTCSRCGEAKPLSKFSKQLKNKDGRYTYCVACQIRRQQAALVAKDPLAREMRLARRREWLSNRRANGYIAPRKYAASYNASQQAANTKLNIALSKGEVLKESCIVCGSKDSEAHHEDYSKPLDVVWMCRKHHKQRHIELRQIKDYGKLILPILPPRP